MKSKMHLVLVFAVVLLVPQLVQAQATSRVIPFNNVATTIAPGSPGQALTLQLWDDPSAGTLQFSEAQTLDVDDNGNISFVLGALTSGGLDPNNFPSGSSRFLDVVDATNASVLPSGRLPMNAVAFALSPGPPGPAGPPGPQGPPGVVQSVAAGDASISVGGSVANPTVAVAANGITNANVANAALSPSKIAGTAATLGANSFTGDQIVIGSVNARGAVSGGAVNTTTQYNIAGSRVVSIPGTNNLFVGVGAGQANTTGLANAFFGQAAGQANTTGNNNVFFGQLAGFSNTTGDGNAFFGQAAGALNTTGYWNAFFGWLAGTSNTTGFENAFFGVGAGASSRGSINAFFGHNAGASNTTGGGNAFFGQAAGASNTTGEGNAFFGVAAGLSNTTESNNTYIGAQAGGSPGITNATAIGSNAQVTQSNSLVLGNNANVGIGTGAPAVRLQVLGDIRVGTSGTNGCVQNFAGTAIAGTCSSDARLKKNVQPFPAVLNKLTQLQPVSFYWKTQDYPEYHFGPSRNYGLIAQEVEKVFPGMVAVDDRGFKAVNYSELPYVMLQAIRELKAENDALGEQLRKLRGEVERLKARRGH